MQLGEHFRFEKISGESIEVADTRLTPQSRVLYLRLPSGGFVWNRPVSVIVERAGTRETLRVPDVTLFTQIALVVSLVALPISIWAMWKGVNQ